MSFMVNVFLMALGWAGFALASYIFLKKWYQESLVCPLKAHCDPVIHSEFATFVGIPVEILGMFYYGSVAVFYGMLAIVPIVPGSTVSFLAVMFSTTAFLFSLYLTFIQAFAIRQWCSWCLVSAGISTTIFFATVWSLPQGTMAFLQDAHPAFAAIHAVATAVGLGAATMTNVFFFMFLKDLRISEFEAAVLRKISDVIWTALAVIVLTGIALFLPRAQELGASAQFLIKVIGVGIIIVSGALLNLLVSPKLIRISFHEKHEHHAGELCRLHRIAFLLGAISLASWYAVFLLGVVKDIPWTLSQFLWAYVLLLVVALVASRLADRRYCPSKG